MTISDYTSAYVWIWLPGAYAPIVAGKLEVNGDHHDFYYGQSYINNSDAIPLSRDDLQLVRAKRFTSMHTIHPVIRDALPDTWGRRVLCNRYQTAELTKLNLLLLSSSDRVGALHFQHDPNHVLPA